MALAVEASTERRKTMKTWTSTLTLAALAATLTLAAGCTEDGPGSVSAVPDPEPGDPAIYAPDGWPLQIGDNVSYDRALELQKEFLAYGGITGIHLVGGRVYGACWGLDESGERIYAGHCPKKARWTPESVQEREGALPERFRGKIEYRSPPSFVRFDTQGKPYVVPEDRRESDVMIGVEGHEQKRQR